MPAQPRFQSLLKFFVSLFGLFLRQDRLSEEQVFQPRLKLPKSVQRRFWGRYVHGITACTAAELGSAEQGGRR
jgi:hypothetical protein